ncbi:hypothetical protein ACIHCQ_22485 [Streptomyces sp. NPDC052236]|uniref:hypothetical protein n=1 Tax=Streptomyces sp. NPDC052236 TaxID=3365686 RepID=UPI0037D6419D
MPDATGLVVAIHSLIREAGPDARDFNEAMAAITKSDLGFCEATAVDLERILQALAAADVDDNG